QKENGKDDDGVGDGEERHGAGSVRQRRDGYEGIGGVEIASEQEPRDERAEASAAEPPLVKKIEIAPTPSGGSETEPRDEGKQQDEDRQRNPVDALHCNSSLGPIVR